jgi:hypothetical protein
MREPGTGQSRDTDFNQFGRAHCGCIGAWHPLVQWVRFVIFGVQRGASKPTVFLMPLS